MIIMRNLLIILLIIFTTSLAWAQRVLNPQSNPSPFCPVEVTDEYIEYKQETKELRESIDLNTFRPPAESLPVMAHVIVFDETNLTGEFTEVEVDAALDELNSYFVQVGLSFKRCLGINYISDVQDYPGVNIYNGTVEEIDGTERNMIATDNNVDGVINLYFAERLWTGTRSTCGTGSFPNGTFDGGDRVWITDGSANTYCLAHEFGHYFDLLHTFSRNNTAFAELVTRPSDGSNICPPGEDCNCGPGIGDELCDTPADPEGLPRPGVVGNYSLNLCRNASCEFDSGAQSWCSIADAATPPVDYTPDPSNIMSYCWCADYFSPQQIDRMRISLMVDADRSVLLENNTDTDDCFTCPSNRNYLGLVYDVNTVFEAEAHVSIISDASLLPNIYDADGNLIDAGANVTYDAGGFVCLNPGFNAEYTSNFLAIIDGCRGEFKIPDSRIDEFAKVHFVVQPNPFREQCTIAYGLVEDENVTISISNIMGKNLITLVNNEQKVTGNHQVNFNAKDFPPGIYYCTIQSGDHIQTQKMVITK